MRIAVTGGAGFIGSHFVDLALDCGHDVIVLDALQYAGNLDNLEYALQSDCFGFLKGDCCDRSSAEIVCKNADMVIHFAAQTHVDRSIQSPEDFVANNVVGTEVMLEEALKAKVKRFVYIGTDEVYGSLPDGKFAKETDAFDASSVYSASKVGAEALVRAYHVTYGLDTIITRGCNTYGPRQYPEKVIPYFCTKAIANENLPLYADGQNVREWLWVGDHCKAIIWLLVHGIAGEAYNIGSGVFKKNIEIAKLILKNVPDTTSKIEFVKDRLGHDKRYALDANKINSLGWFADANFKRRFKETVVSYIVKGGDKEEIDGKEGTEKV